MVFPDGGENPRHFFAKAFGHRWHGSMELHCGLRSVGQLLFSLLRVERLCPDPDTQFKKRTDLSRLCGHSLRAHLAAVRGFDPGVRCVKSLVWQPTSSRRFNMVPCRVERWLKHSEYFASPCHDRDRIDLDSPMWSLIHELRISFILPLLIIFSRRFGFASAFVAAAFCLVCVNLNGHAAYLSHLSSWISTGTYLYFFVLGTLLALNIDKSKKAWQHCGERGLACSGS